MKYEKSFAYWNKQYALYKNQRQIDILSGKNSYSLINSLLSINDEVNLHSKFIYSMINPNGSHLQKTLFLRLFLESIDLELAGKLNYENISVKREKDNIDLLIDDGQTYIIIENKLNAVDQYEQIYRYIREVCKNNCSLPKCDKGESTCDTRYCSIDIVVIYLSKSNKILAKQSLGPYRISHDHQYLEYGDKRIQYFHINYAQEIPAWVKKSLEAISNISNLCNAFEEYQSILNRVNKIMSKKEVINFKEFILDQKSEEVLDEYLEFSAYVMQNFYSIWSERIIRIIDSIDGLSEALITDANEFPINGKSTNKRQDVNHLTVSSLIKWFKEDGYKENYKDIGFCFYGTGKNGEKTKNILLFAVGYLYIAPYHHNFHDFNQANDRGKNTILNKDPRKIIKDPEKVQEFCDLIRKRIIELLGSLS